MSDIFISYNREDQATARKVADALEAEGWTVWWDPNLRAGEHFDDVIEKALDDAKCVIVMWSNRSVQSQYVRDEATYALDQNKLAPVAIENVNLPFRFKGVHTPSLVGWDGSKDFPEFRTLVEYIASILGPPLTEAEQKAKEDNRKRIFISYRRDDSAGYANAIHSRLVQDFAKDQVLMDVDVDTVKPGVDLVRVIEEAVDRCDVLLALIGKRWANVDSLGRSRLDNPKDFVRLEISTALARDIRVIPVLVDGMTMPTEDSLPSSVQHITRRNAIEISNTRFNSDVDRLITAVRRILKTPEPKRKADEKNRRRIEEERSRAEQEATQLRLEAEARRKVEEERKLSEEEARRKADEEKEKTRPQRRPGIGTYDVFISFKNTDENGVPTRDAELANEVYNFLTSKGLKVFISTATLESLGVSDYTKAINDALDTASIVVAVGTSAENLDSEWVRYEWGSFYNDILSRKKPGGQVFTYILGLRPAQLPRTLRQTQTFIHSSEALRQLHGFIVQALR
jgi:TIR domain